MAQSSITRIYNQSGHAIITSVIFVAVTLVLTLGYLSWVGHEKVALKREYAEVQADLAARSGLAETVYPMIIAHPPSMDTAYGEFPLEAGSFQEMEFQRSYRARASANHDENYQNTFVGVSTGKVMYENTKGDPVTVQQTLSIRTTPEDYSKFMYFTQDEKAGGGPYVFDGPGARRNVTFGSNDVLEGRVHSNGTLVMSNFGCPTFTGHVSTAPPEDGGGITLGGVCTLDGILNGEEARFDTTDDAIKYPPPGALERIRAGAKYTFDGGELIGGTRSIDSLIMTEIEFQQGGFVVSRWAYTIPSSQNNDPDTVAMYHPDRWTVMGRFHHFDFPKPTSPDGYVEPPHFIPSNEGVIYVKNGQVLVHGVVEGRFTIATDWYTVYRAEGGLFSTVRDTVFDNIWITDDIRYVDSNPTNGRVIEGSPNRLGLVSGANVIIANTLANGAANQRADSDVIINAAIMAMHESFMAQYWQNTTTAAWDPPLGDGRGPDRVNFGNTTGDADFRGTIHLYGSIVQMFRGYVKRNQPGPYPTGDIGFVKDYHYDENFLDYPPPLYPVQTMEDGRVAVKLTDYTVGDLERE